MRNKTSEFLEKAQIAIQKGDQKAATSLINQVLQQDINHSEAWQLLYNHFGGGESFEGFQQKYAKKYFPKRMNELIGNYSRSTRRVSLTGGREPSSRGGIPKRAPDAGDKNAGDKTGNNPPKKEKKPGLFSRLFSIFRRKPKIQSEPPTAKPSQPSPSPTNLSPPSVVEKNSLRLSSLKNSPPSPSASLRDELSITPPSPTVTAPILSSFREAPVAPTDEKIRVLVVDDIAQTRENLIKLLSLESSVQVIGSARSGREGVSMAVERDPHVVLMDINMPDMDGLEATRLIRSKIPYVQVVILTVQDDPSYMREAIVAGARDFLVKPPMVDELLSAVQRAYIIAREEKARMPPQLPPEYASFVSPSSQLDKSKCIISIYSPKGGVGCTTLASNLAVALQSDSTPVIVVDACLHFGGVSISFNERGKHSLLDLTPRVQHLDPEVVNGVVLTHAGSNVRILAAPDKVSDAETVDPNQIGPLLDYLATIFTYVIVDTSTDLTEHTLAVLDASDLVFLVTSQDIPSLDRMRRFLDLASAIGLNKDRFRMVISRFSDKINITPERISQNFKQEISSIIPYDYAVVAPSTNQGAPFMMDKKLKGRPIFKAISDLAHLIEKEGEAAR
jgi:pilus assembly protein CpaE